MNGWAGKKDNKECYEINRKDKSKKCASSGGSDVIKYRSSWQMMCVVVPESSMKGVSIEYNIIHHLVCHFDLSVVCFQQPEYTRSSRHACTLVPGVFAGYFKLTAGAVHLRDTSWKENGQFRISGKNRKISKLLISFQMQFYPFKEKT